MSGYMGKYLIVDLSNKSHEVVSLTDGFYRKFLSGYGLGAAVITARQKPGIDPLSPESYLGFCTGLLTGTGASRMCLAETQVSGIIQPSSKSRFMNEFMAVPPCAVGRSVRRAIPASWLLAHRRKSCEAISFNPHSSRRPRRDLRWSESAFTRDSRSSPFYLAPPSRMNEDFRRGKVRGRERAVCRRFEHGAFLPQNIWKTRLIPVCTTGKARARSWKSRGAAVSARHRRSCIFRLTRCAATSRSWSGRSASPCSPGTSTACG